jgi:predicted adenylyl cyclase CyaB
MFVLEVSWLPLDIILDLLAGGGSLGSDVICLDEVRDLGTFIELEKITEGEDPIKVQSELFAFLKSLGVREEDRVERGYDTLLYLAKAK